MASAVLVTEGTLTLDGTEQEIFSVSGQPTLYGLSIEIVGAASGVVIIHTYIKVISTGTWVLLDDTEIAGVPTKPGYQTVFLPGTQGVRFTIEKTAGSAYDCDYAVNKIVT
jgi:hypothetical protein